MSNEFGAKQFSDSPSARQSLRNDILTDSALHSAIREAASQDARYLPCSGNLGDGLIGLGTLDLFEFLGVSPAICRASDEMGLSAPGVGETSASYIIVGGSGGWLQGRWEHFATTLQPFLEAGGRVLILPSTVKGFEDFFRRYASQITIFARERTSYEHLSTIPQLKGRLHLSHDLAFATDIERLGWDYDVPRIGTLNILRQDEESNTGQDFRLNFDLSLLWNGIEWGNREVCERHLAPVAGVIKQFLEVRTDRLHMTALAAMLGCRVTMYPSSYFKNEAVYEHSLSRFKNVTFDRSNLQGGYAAPPNQPQAETLEASDTDIALSSGLQETRFRNLKLGERVDGLRKALEASREELANLRMHIDELQIANASLRQVQSEWEYHKQSRGYRLWQSYNACYEHAVYGPYLRRVRALVGKVMARLRGPEGGS